METQVRDTAPMPQPTEQVLVALRARGAGMRYPLRLHFVESLAQRVASQQGRARELLKARLATAIADLSALLDKQESGGAQVPEAMPAARTTLADLTRYLTTSHADDPVATTAQGTRTRTELKAVRAHRSTWSQLSADQDLKVALGRAPRNAGPMNSHRLVLQSLTRMREIAPDYLHRFMAYADALLCLDAVGKEVSSPSGKPRAPRKFAAAASASSATARKPRTPSSTKEP